MKGAASRAVAHTLSYHNAGNCSLFHHNLYNRKKKEKVESNATKNKKKRHIEEQCWTGRGSQIRCSVISTPCTRCQSMCPSSHRWVRTVVTTVLLHLYKLFQKSLAEPFDVGTFLKWVSQTHFAKASLFYMHSGRCHRRRGKAITHIAPVLLRPYYE